MKRFLCINIVFVIIIGILNSCKHEIIPEPDPIKEDKYGVFSNTVLSFSNCVDGKYFYGDMTVKETNEYGITSSEMIFGKRDYPYGTEWTPVCSDSLCTHKSGSGCPLSACGGGRFVCYEGKILFYTLSGDLYVYDKTTNKSVKTADNFFNARFYKQDGGLYAVFNRESRDFDVMRVFAKVSSDGVITELGEYNGYYGSISLLYAERYAVDVKRTNDDSTHKSEIILYDLTTKEQKIIAELDYPQAQKNSYMDTLLMIYGDKLYIKVQYRIEEEDTSRRDAWLIDLATGEKRLLCTEGRQNYGTDYAFCRHSDTCIAWYEPRPTDETPFVLHILFPEDNVEETYNLSKMAASIGETIDTDNFFTAIDFGVVRVRKNVKLDHRDEKTGLWDTDVDTFRFDIVNGKAYKIEGELTS